VQSPARQQARETRVIVRRQIPRKRSRPRGNVASSDCALIHELPEIVSRTWRSWELTAHERVCTSKFEWRGVPRNVSDDHPAERSCPPQTILFVEDEALVRIEMEEFLRECGYRVHGVANAAEAIEALEAKFAIDLVFTDINLGPGKNGIELADVPA
jgi:hypothetical protein